MRTRLNPRFDGAFLNWPKSVSDGLGFARLNPRFDGAFLNLIQEAALGCIEVLIPDLMGLF